jgi:hypothetical protein
VFYPQDNSYIWSSLEAFSNSAHWRWQVSPLLLLRLMDGSLVSSFEQIRFSGLKEGFLEYQATEGKLMARIFLSPRDASLRMVYAYEPGERLLASAQLLDVRQYKGYLRPRRIEVELYQENERIKIGIIEEVFDTKLSDKYFLYRLPPSAQPISLN